MRFLLLLILMLPLSACVPQTANDSERTGSETDESTTDNDQRPQDTSTPAKFTIPERPIVCAPDPQALSPLARSVLERIQTPESFEESPVPQELLLTGCNRLDTVMVDGPNIFGAFRDAIADAQHEVDIAFFAWEESSEAAALIGEGLRQAAANREPTDKLLVRILVTDSQIPFSGRTINNLYNSQKNWKLDSSKIELQLATYPQLALGVLHDKYLVVDGKVLVVTGANPQKFHDLPIPWHDTGYLLRGDVALSALASFDEAWDHHAEHWTCRPQTAQFDCEQTEHNDADRSWLAATEWDAGSTRVIAVGRKAKGYVNDGTENPQDLAWITAMDRARENVNIISPNINDDAFQDAVIRAAARGVKVQLITSKGFNKTAENLPGQGGFNREVVGKLRQRMLHDHVEQRGNLELCWYSRDGIQPVVGNGPGASHVKFLSVDDQLAIVGSGNMDTQSWNNSREFNVLIDDPEAVAAMARAFLATDWERAICQLVELWEGNNGTQDLVCSKGALHNHTAHLSDDICVDDEARSLTLRKVPAGRVFRLYDDPNGNREDDWIEIRVLRDIREKTIGTFESSFQDSEVRVIYHRNNGLDGKVSRYEASSQPSESTVDLYEGNNGTQNLVCSLPVGQERTVIFTGHPECDNDEARSLVLHDLPADRVLLVFDSPDGSLEDDWTAIRTLQPVTERIVHSFQTAVDDSQLQVVPFRNNGLDGKASRLRSTTVDALGGVLSFYEGNDVSQNKVCDLDVRDNVVDFKDFDPCDNDEARSLQLTFVPVGAEIAIFDDPDCETGDDFTEIVVERAVFRRSVDSFERSFSDDDLTVTYHEDNGLDGKVSCVRIDSP